MKRTVLDKPPRFQLTTFKDKCKIQNMRFIFNMPKTKKYCIIFKLTSRYEKKIFSDSRNNAWRDAQKMEKDYIELGKVVEQEKEIESIEEE